MNSIKTADAPMPTITRSVWDGFDVCRLDNDFVEVAVVPELGAKVVSLKNRQTGREWMYHPGGPGQMKLFRNQLGDDFARSPMTGWDECLPTISPCIWRGRALPDHGEVWSVPWQLDEAAWRAARIQTTLRLPVSPFEFTRVIELQGDTLLIHYQLTNQSDEPQEYLWAMHPLLALRPGDQLMLDREIRRQWQKHPWIDSLQFPENAAAAAKVFAGPLAEGWAGVRNAVSGDELIFRWDPAECDTLGLWLTRGGWHGHHHLALEPTNGAADSLVLATREGKPGDVLAPLGHKEWKVQIQLQSLNHVGAA
jgi:galactose mutarotase-like enzyme